MQALIKNLPWLAPTAAIVLSASFLGTTWLINKEAKNNVPSAEEVAQAQIAEQRRWDDLNALVGAATQGELTSTAAVPDVSDTAAQEIAENLVAVTRNAPLPLLETPERITPLAEPVTAPTPVSSGSAAEFFANAQANLASDDSCGEDLRALAAGTRIYFPAGGLTAEANGLIKARVIGQLAHNCKEYTVQVEGHSDPSGNSDVNLRLSKQRAQAVINRLASGGIDTSNFIAVGRGDEQPSGIEGPKGAAYYDRRVEFAIVKAVKTASASSTFAPAAWRTEPSDCVRALERKVEQSRLIYAPRAITVSPSELDVVFELASAAAQCEGARLRLVGQHSDDLGTRESVETGRLRALVLMGSLVSAGFESETILIGAPSYSVTVPNQPGLPKSRVDFQLIMD